MSALLRPPLAHLAGMRIEFNAAAVTRTEHFPFSRHRSRRIHKKLLRRHGVETRIADTPGIFLFDGRIVAHPRLKHLFTPEAVARMMVDQASAMAEVRRGIAEAAQPPRKIGTPA